MKHIQVDHRRVVHDIGVVLTGKEITRAAHVRCELVYFVEMAVNDRSAELRVAKIADDAIVGHRLGEFRLLQIRSANPETFKLKPSDEMRTDEAAPSQNKCYFVRHLNLILIVRF